MAKVKIVLDSDVIIHFIKAGCVSALFKILPSYEYIILSQVYDELKAHQTQIENQIIFFHDLRIENYSPKGNAMVEFFRLNLTMGKGESACMVYCKENNYILGSSNINDIHLYCNDNGITYLTTLDFLYYAYKNKVMTQEECNQFMSDVKNSGSKLPKRITDRVKYNCTVSI